MPMYAYSPDDGNTVYWEFRKMPDPPKNITVNGEKCERFMAAEGKSRRWEQQLPDWPRESLSQGVTPEQAKAAADLDRQLGVPTDYKVYPDIAMPVFRDKSHQRRWQHAHKKVNLDSYE